MGQLLSIAAAWLVALGFAFSAGAFERRASEDREALRPALQLAQRGGSCKAAGTCEEAVRMWCDGYRRADADGDGIPCENVCRSLAQVEVIKRKIGC